MQSGKTTAAIKNFQTYLQKEDCLPIFATHASNNVLQDLMQKMEAEGILSNNTILNPRDNRGDYNKFLSRLMKYNTIDDNFGIVGLKNESFFKRLDSALLHYHQEKVLFNDEYDTDQIRFVNKRQPVKRDNQIRSYDIEGVIDTMELLSATNLAALISDAKFDKVEFIPHEAGYNDELNFVTVSERALECLRNGELHDDIHENIVNTTHNVMINVSTLQDDHTTIANCLDDFRFNSMVVNSDDDEVYDLSTLDTGKTMLIGGNMFNRGQTFNRIQTLIFDRPTHQAAMLQAVGRLFGYRNYKTKIVCSSEMRDQIEEAFNLEKRITKDILELPATERRKWLESQSAPEKLSVFSSKDNGWMTKKIADYAVVDPVYSHKYDEDFFRNEEITMLQKRVEGPPPARGQNGYYGTCKWGNRTVEKYVDDFCNQHPQGRVLSEPNEKGDLRRKTIVPPFCERWWDEKERKYHHEYEQVDRNKYKRHHLEEHFWIDNSYNADIRETCMTKYVGSVLANGRVAVWHNLNILSDDREITRFSKK